MSAELLPDGKTGPASKPGGYFSVSEIAFMRLEGFPKSRAGVYKRVLRERWPVVLIQGRGSSVGVQYFKVPEFYLPKKKDFQYKTTDSATFHAVREPGHDERVYVERYLDVYGSAGPGHANDNEWLVERVAFNATELHNRIGVPAKHLKLVGVDGYSMEPFIFHGDQVFVDTRYDTFKNDGVYAILHDGELRFKRVRVNFSDKTVMLKSDNDGGMGPEVLSESQANELQIIGKVIPFKFGHFKL